MTRSRSAMANAAGGAPLASEPILASLSAFGADPVQLPPQPSAAERQLTQRLQGFFERLRHSQFQLAVVGQFKRGKSSLLNALLGHEVLPTGILPLTALPTFIRAGRGFDLDVTFAGGEVRRFTPKSAEALQEATAEFVTELANPANIKGVRQVDLAIPSPLLEAGVVLLDTPGVGSAALHNTQAAEDALPECDAALMVLSPEPPITEAELVYLAKVRNNAARIVVACNKVDAATDADVDTIVSYLHEMLGAVGLPEMEIFRVSARGALAAMAAGDAQALADSGMPALREHLIDLANTEGRQLLAEAVGRKAAAIVRDLEFENDLMVAALTAPADALARQSAAFDQARSAFNRERRSAADQLEGDRRRLLQTLDADAERETQGLSDRLNNAIADAAMTKTGLRQAWERLRAALPEELEILDVKFGERQRAALEVALSAHQGRADALLEGLRRTAADLLQVAYQAPASETAFSVRVQPYWVNRPRESLADGPVGLVERLIPGALGRQFALKRICLDIHQVATTNIEHMRWACRQNLEDALRRYGSDLDNALASGAASIGDGLAAAAHLRSQGEIAMAQSVSERAARKHYLRSLIGALERLEARLRTH